MDFVAIHTSVAPPRTDLLVQMRRNLFVGARSVASRTEVSYYTRPERAVCFWLFSVICYFPRFYSLCDLKGNSMRISVRYVLVCFCICVSLRYFVWRIQFGMVALCKRYFSFTHISMMAKNATFGHLMKQLSKAERTGQGIFHKICTVYVYVCINVYNKDSDRIGYGHGHTN